MEDANEEKEGENVQEGEIEVEKVKKPRVKPIRLKAEDLINVDTGLLKLYESTKQLSNHGDVDSARFVGKMIGEIKSWTNSIMPRYDFEYFCERCHKLGSTQDVANFLAQLRAYHIGEVDVKDLKAYQASLGERKQLQIFTEAAEENGLKNQKSLNKREFVFKKSTLIE